MRSDPAPGGVKCLDGIGIVDGDLLVRLNNDTSAIAVDPFESVAGHAFAGFALKNKALKVRLARFAFAVLNLLGHFGEFFPGLGRFLIAILFQQICSIIEGAGVGEPGDGNQFSVHRVVLQ